MLVLIPAYRPDTSLIMLAHDLDTQAVDTGVTIHLLVVDDGSGSDYQPIFSQVASLVPVSSSSSLERQLVPFGLSAVTVLHLPVNSGKGVALRVGLAWAQAYLPGESVITADADGQHLAEDIIAVGKVTEQCACENASHLVLGVRALADPSLVQGSVPFRSRVGNRLTASLFWMSTGQNLADTQTGLRGLTPLAIPWALELPGDRYDYEFTMLLQATRSGVSLAQVPVHKIYEQGNPTSHFRPVRDSLRIYVPLLAFLGASFFSFVFDALVLFLLVTAGMAVFPAVCVARVVSALGNFALNRLILRDGGCGPSTQRSLERYTLLAVVILALNGVAMEALTRVGLPLMGAKVLAEGALIPLSFVVQRRWVFAPNRHGSEPTLSLCNGAGGKCFCQGVGGDVCPLLVEPEILSANSSGKFSQTPANM